ncbi:MAG: alpha/beta fold hydrolase, partial [Pseudomonadota bacterium]
MKTHQKLCDGKFSVEMEVTGRGEPLLFLHGAGGLTGADPFLEDLGRNFKVYAPHLPGYGESTGGEHLDDVIDAALFFHELMDELKIPSANLVGHSMGGMLAAEMAALCNHRAKRLVLAAPAGFWLDEHPIPDLFAAQLDEIAGLLFHDPKSPAAQLMTTIPTDFEALQTMYVERVKRLGIASKFLWPIPDRGLKKRAYRITSPTLLIWGESDKLIPKIYAREFSSRIRDCREHIIKAAGHMVPYEQPAEFCKTVRDFLK